MAGRFFFAPEIRYTGFQLYRLKYKGADGLKVNQQIPIMPECEDPYLHSTDSSTLLPADRGLLDINFSDLDSDPAIVRQTWRSEIGNASSPGCSTLDDPLIGSPPPPALPVDTEGSI